MVIIKILISLACYFQNISLCGSQQNVAYIWALLSIDQILILCEKVGTNCCKLFVVWSKFDMEHVSIDYAVEK